MSDPFDLLPDPLIMLIFNKMQDIKALGRCSAVCRRFKNAILQVDDIFVKVDCVISAEDTGLHVKGKGLLGHFFRLLIGSLVKPLHALHHILTPKRRVRPEALHHSPGEVLKNFVSVRNLKINLPGGELGIEEGAFLKWRAEFGSTLESCVILSASSLVNMDKHLRSKVIPAEACMSPHNLSPVHAEDAPEHQASHQDSSSSIPESFFINGGLKLRVVWTISSLIAASARHFLLQQIVLEHPTLESLILADADGQGTLCMGKEQLQDFRDKPIAASASSNRTQVPALNIKLWYAPYLNLPGGGGMRGATLVAIRPSNQSAHKETNASFLDVFEEPLRSAARSLINRKTYLLEMNSF